MIIEIKYLFLLIAFTFAEKQIDLEDIERDTLISEQRSNAKESLTTDQTQHIRPPVINVQQYEVNYLRSKNHIVRKHFANFFVFLSNRKIRMNHLETMLLKTLLMHHKLMKDQMIMMLNNKYNM